MKFNLGFFVREALTNVRLNLLMSITAVTTTFVCILVLGVGLLVSSHIEGIVGSVRDDVGVEAYFASGATDETVTELRDTVQNYPEVASVTYVSEAEALSTFKDTFADRPELYEDIAAGVLPASLQLQLEDPSAADAVAERLRDEEAVQSLSYPQQTIERLNEVTSFISWALYGATILFLVASVLLISNAIRLSIFARRDEIEVMKLVGASDRFVRTPFVIEGLAQGLVGALIAALAVAWINFLFIDWAEQALPFVPISSNAVNTPVLVLALVVVGVGIGVVGSFLSVTRFLRKV